MNYETIVKGSLKEVALKVVEGYLKESRFSSVTEKYEYCINGANVEIDLIERVKTSLGERVALQLTFMENNDEVIINAIATGFEGFLFNNGPEGKQSAINRLKKVIESLEL